jgi:hypothetical protein
MLWQREFVWSVVIAEWCKEWLLTLWMLGTWMAFDFPYDSVVSSTSG